VLPEYKKQAELGLKVAAGHLEGVRRMVEQDAYCIDLMKQVSAVQGTLQRVQRIFLRNHLSSCVSEAIKNGMGESVIDQLMTSLKYDTSLIDGRGSDPSAGRDGAASRAGADEKDNPAGSPSEACCGAGRTGSPAGGG
jgi:CsoR family transcriptional regulator, copper-sensing transcriptional repressor